MDNAPTTVKDLDFLPAVPLHLSPLDWRDQFSCFLLVDRFDNNAAAIPPYSLGVTATGRDAAQGAVFQGGNLKGILRHLDYIQGLGCTTLWLSLIFKNRQDQTDSYHGYGIQDFIDIDPRFGTLDDLRELVAAAHARGMYVIQDIILNHTGDVWSYPGGHPYFDFGAWRESDSTPGLQQNDGIWPVELQHADNFKRMGEIRGWTFINNGLQEARDGDFLSLKELDLARPQVLDTLIKAYKYWINQVDIDGFRIDTVKHMETSATAIFCNVNREHAQRVGKHNFFLFGDLVADDAFIQQYIGRNSRIENSNERFPSLDAALDFPLYFVLEETIKGFFNPAALRQRYDFFRDHYTDHGAAGRYFVTFVDSHDQMSRPYRRFTHNSSNPPQAVLAIGYLLTSQGVPCIYYETEQGCDGGGDNDRYVRECMFGGQWGAFNTTGAHFFDTAHPIYQGIHAIVQLRQQHAALRYGRQYFRKISGNGIDFGYPLDGRRTPAWSRILDSEEVPIALNLDSQPRTDHITVDRNLSAPGQSMNNLLQPGVSMQVRDSNGRACVQVALPA